MQLGAQKRFAAHLLKCSEKRVWFDESRLDEIKEGITKEDIRRLIHSGTIREKPKVGISKGRTRKLKTQKSKGRRSNAGSKKGSKNARLSSKTVWINKIRKQRELLQKLKTEDKISQKDFRQLYSKAKGGFFRNLRHMKLYMTEAKMITTAKKSKEKVTK
ncbi:50S ribosomal protein L19e [Nanoarchaeota archaeon]